MNNGSTRYLDELLETSERRAPTQLLPNYEEKAGALMWNKGKNTQVPLCNFNAYITSEIIHDDGAEKRMVFNIEGKTADGKPLPPVEVPTDKYAAMAWVNGNWGSKAIVYAGFSLKDHLRVAIQTRSGEVPQKTIYAHLGWRKISGKWFYLHADGVIGEPGVDLKICVSTADDRLKSYRLPAPPSGKELLDSIQSSLVLLKMAPLRITAPLLAAIYRGPLGEAYGIDFSLFLSGASGSQKSECSAMAQAHFGMDFTRLNLPGNWVSTGNSLERQAFLVKDALFTVDDFAPTGAASDVAKLHQKADRLLRGQGNKAGRGRLTAEAKARPEYYPRGIIVSSGEDVPRGPSLRARTLILEISRGDVNLECLTVVQAYAKQGLLAKSMAGFTQWLAPKLEQFREKLPKRHLELRKEINLENAHARTPDLVISLWLGLEVFLEYALDSDAIGVLEKEELSIQGWEAIQGAGSLQSEFQIGEDSTSKFLDLLCSALVSGLAHLVDSKTGYMPIQGERYGWRPEGSIIRYNCDNPEPENWRPLGYKIGWVEGNELFLNPGAAYACAQDIARKQNDSIPTTANTLWKRLVQKGYATRGEAGKNLGKRTVQGVRQLVLIIPDKEILYGPKSRGIRGTGYTGILDGPSYPQKVPLDFMEAEKQGRKLGAESLDYQGVVPAVPSAPLSQVVPNQLNLEGVIK